MRENLVLGSKAFEQAISILNREQRSNLPTKRQEIVFRLFNFVVYFFVGLCGFTIAGHLFGFHEEMEALWILQAVLIIPIGILFLLNIGLVLKLKRQAALRKQLGLDQGLKVLFQTHRRRKWFSNAGTLIVSFFGYPLVFIGLALFVILSILSISENESDYLFASLIGLGPTFLGLSFVSLHYMRRGKQRLEIANQLRTILAKYEGVLAEDGSGSVNIAADEYEQIARIERSQIIADRQSSIVKGRKEVRSSGYLIQQSRDVQAAKAQLNPAVSVRVDDQILQLTSDPMPTGTERDSDTGTFHLRVPETDVDLFYQVDEGSRRVRVGRLMIAADQESSGPAAED